MFRGVLTCLFLSMGAFAQSTFMTCAVSANPPLVRVEGVAERTGDVVFSCQGGQPNTTITGNFVLFLSVSVTNRVLPDGSADIVLTVNGAPANVPARITSANTIAFNGLNVPVSSQGATELRLQNVRGNASELAGVNGRVITLYATFTGGSIISFTSNQFTVGIPQTGLFSSSSGTFICSQAGVPVPSTLTVASLAANSIYTTTRVTEGFGTAFASKSDFSSQNADTGTRIIVNYGGFPAGARLFVPDIIAGSSADKATSAGDFGIPSNGGQYTPGKNQLLLVRVNGADANGAGGTLASPKPTVPSVFTSVGELSLNAGAAYAVYEVVDSDPAVIESAMIPVFLGLAPNGPTAVTTSSVSFAPVTTVRTASSTAPIPRFVSVAPPSDCTALGDCSASYFPKLITTVANSLDGTLRLDPNAATGFVVIQNAGSGILQWRATTTATFLKLSPASGYGSGSLRIDTVTGLAPGMYQGTIVIDAGLAGSKTIPVTLTVPVSDPVLPSVSGVTNAADPSLTAVVPGSIITVWGSRFSGKSLQVTFDGRPGQVLFSNATQINVVAPSPITAATTQLRVIVDGIASATQTLNVAAAAPAIFPGAVLNADNTVNSQSSPAQAGSVIQVFATGLPLNGPIAAKIHDRMIVKPDYGGAAPGLPGVQQVNATIPGDLPAMQSWVYVCSGDLCSAPVKLWISQ